MPAISASAQNLVRDSQFTKADVVELRNAVATHQATPKDVERIASALVDAFTDGAGTEMRQLLKELGLSVDIPLPIANLEKAPGLMHGTTSFPRDAVAKKDELLLFQRGLIALASRTGDPNLMLSKFGADGGWSAGGETELAVRALQKKTGLPETGIVDQTTAKKLNDLVKGTNIPPIFAGGVDPKPLTTEAVANAAQMLCTKRPDAYGVDDAWVNCDPRHALPANVPIGGLKGKWKCNLFACNTLAAAGFEPPYYGNKGRGEYPNANQLFKWSDTYASSNGNAGNVRFALQGEMSPNDFPDAAVREQTAKDLLTHVEPGDLVIVDHQGSGVADGGHCRVCVAKNSDGTFEFAQASFGQAEVQHESHLDVMNEEHIWILRPNKRRPEGPAPVT